MCGEIKQMSYSDLFNSKGELNASSKQEALLQLSKIASLLDGGLPSNVGLTSRAEISADRRDQLFEKALYSQEGKIALAQAMSNPIR